MVIPIRARESKVCCQLASDQIPIFLFISAEIGFDKLLCALWFSIQKDRAENEGNQDLFHNCLLIIRQDLTTINSESFFLRFVADQDPL